MGILDEKVEIQIKMSKPVKYLIIGLLIGGVSSLVGSMLSHKFLVKPKYDNYVEQAQSNAFTQGFHMADSVYKAKLQETIAEVPRVIEDVDIRAILLDQTDTYYLGLLAISFDFGVAVPQNSSKDDIERIIKRETKKMGGNLAVMRGMEISNKMFLDVYYKAPPKKKKWYEF